MMIAVLAEGELVKGASKKSATGEIKLLQL